MNTDSTTMPSGSGLRDPSQAMHSPPCMDLVRELRWKWAKRERKRKNVKNRVKKLPPKKRKTFTIGSDDTSESEYSTSSSQNTNFNPSSDNWSSSEDENCTPDVQWDEFLAKLLQGHKTPAKTSTQQVLSQHSSSSGNFQSPATDSNDSD